MNEPAYEIEINREESTSAHFWWRLKSNTPNVANITSVGGFLTYEDAKQDVDLYLTSLKRIWNKNKNSDSKDSVNI